MFHIIASTGRTATTFIAAVLNEIPGITACHEGYVGSDHEAEPLLPLINLENNLAYQKPETAGETVRQKRSKDAIADALVRCSSQTLVDVAYYNPTIAAALLDQHPELRMVGIIREPEGFVISATQMEGEDLLPVGWPDPAKELTDREKFIGFGRIRPRRGSEEANQWKDWSAIRRNVWLWRETNRLLAEAREKFPDRVTLIDFRLLKSHPDRFWERTFSGFAFRPKQKINHHLVKEFRNRKPGGAQIGPAETWTPDERAALELARAEYSGFWDDGIRQDHDGSGVHSS